MKKLSKFLSAVFFTSLSSFVFAGTLSPADAQIVAQINAKLAADHAITSQKVYVTSHGGHVQLIGKIDTSAQANKIIEIAESVDHVKDVNNKSLKVKKSDHAMQDAALTAKVKGVYLREKLFGDADVSVWSAKVETKNKVVYLTGEVDNQAQINNAVKLAKSVKGVKRVKSALVIKKD